jgi:hypothetical protein
MRRLQRGFEYPIKVLNDMVVQQGRADQMHIVPRAKRAAHQASRGQNRPQAKHTLGKVGLRLSGWRYFPMEPPGVESELLKL